jgi:hypothetical protein
LFAGKVIAPEQPSEWLKEAIEIGANFSLNTETTTLNDVITAAIPQCVAEMYATQIWNEKQGEPLQTIYGAVTAGDKWLFLHYKNDMLIEVDKVSYALKDLSELLGVWQHIIGQFK